MHCLFNKINLFLISFKSYFILISVITISADGANCPPLPYSNLPNGKIIYTGTGKLHFQCEVNYFLAGRSEIKCKNGSWTSSKTPVCLKAEGLCEPPTKIPNADIFGEDLRIGSVIQYICHPGYLIYGEGQRMCLNVGSWSGITPACLNETEPLEDVAMRLEKQFVTKMSSYSNNKVQARALDEASLLRGLELVILIDRSSSVDPVDLEKGKTFIKFLFERFQIKNGENPNGARTAVVAFGTEVEILFNVNNATINSSKIAGEVLDKSLQSGGGGTAMNPALFAVYEKVENLLRKDAKRAVFLISDGEPNVGGKDVDDTATTLKEIGGFEIFAVGIGRDINRQTLSSMVSEPVADHVFLLEKYENLEEIMAIIKAEPEQAPPPPPWKCGHPNPKNRWPWNAGIYIPQHNTTENTTNLKFCGGALICHEWVLTAASCFYSEENYEANETDILDPEEVTIILGENNLQEIDPNEMSFYAKRINIHPNFNPFKSLYNNLAIIQLNVHAPVKKFRPICLPPTNRPVPLHLMLNLNTTIRAWGLSEPTFHSQNITPGSIRYISYKEKSVILTHGLDCRQSTAIGIKGRSIFCVSSGTEYCLGNIGTPVAVQDPNSGIQHLLGILSQRTKCEKGYSQYTELIKYVPWINNVTSNCHSKHWNS